MTANDQPDQMSYDEVKRLSKTNPEAITKAMAEGRLTELMSGHGCPSCGRPMSNPPPSAA